MALKYDEIIELAKKEKLSHIMPELIHFADEVGEIELKNWLLLEYNGYYNKNEALKDSKEVPDYRQVPGQFFDFYNQPLIIEDADFSFINILKLRNGVAELENYKEDKFYQITDPKLNNVIFKYLKVKVHYFSFHGSTVLPILTSIRSTLLTKLLNLKFQSDKFSKISETVAFHPIVEKVAGKLFEDGYYKDTQILSYVYSYDSLHLPDVLAICATSAALAISDIPLKKPVGAVRVGYINNEYIINPTSEEMKNSELDLILSGTDDAILMIEGYSNFLTEEQILEAIDLGHKAIQTICLEISAWAEKIGKEKNRKGLHVIDQKIIDDVAEKTSAQIITALSIKDKKLREQDFDDLNTKLIETYKLDTLEPIYPKRDVFTAFKKINSSLMRKKILDENKRIDGREFNEIRKIDSEIGFLGRTHGSAVFTRGETQAIAVCTLGGENMAERYEDLHGDGVHRFYLHYFFPPFSVGEVGRVGFPGRREIGHGKLAERALMSALPDQKDFPYIIRLEANITESNGSSSMASVCSGCLSLMDAGVPIKRPVSGIAMGLILEEEKFVILSDIMGAEDALGDMDFKIKIGRASCRERV